MTTLNFVGWETGYQLFTFNNMGEAYTGAGTASISSVSKRSGAYSLIVNPTTTAVGYAVIGTQPATGGAGLAYNEPTIYARFYHNPATLPAANNEEIFVARTTAAAYKFALRINSSGKLMAFASDGTTQLGSDGTTTVQLWDRIECKVGTGAAADYEVLINGVSELSGTGNLSTTNNGDIAVGKVTNRNSQSVVFYYDDVLISNSAYPGDSKCKIMIPNGDGTYTAWTIGAGGGADWENVDEVPNDGTTTYLLSTLTIGEASTVTIESAATAGISGTILAVKPISIHSRVTLSASPKLRFRSGATEVDSAAISQGTGAFVAASVNVTDPNTSAAWELAALSSLEVGMVGGSSSRQTVMTSDYVMVEFIAGGARSYGYIF